MCTLIAFWRAVPGYDVVLGMNRDESAARPADPPSFLEGDPPVVAPRDLKAGGTWIGVNGKGLCIALSNRRGRNSETARSRGRLVLDVLRAPTVAAVDILLQNEVRDHEYNYWNLMAMSRPELRFFHYDGRLSTSRGREGLNVLTNEGANLSSDPKVQTIKRLAPGGPPRSIEDAIGGLQAVLRTHDSDRDRASLCVHTVFGGTVSSTIFALSNADPQENVLLYAPGPPCTTAYRAYDEAIRRLRTSG